ncbi:calcium/sodium antiporter [Palleronia sediminis]|uniref:Calcium/sodium antiporter n=1 Tax=Palleronia sediminis TaxID=2547833 RepID=A0A4R6A3F9_9RHOB|nr:calcium/sodium antiporter [Palleronia sediminis]TDL75223.1 calcium/sodium antiporter [Palleronia sediminis]
MLLAFLLTVVGLVILIVAGDLLVRGAVNLSLRLGVPAMIVSLTVVAFGTSAPELVISIGAILDGAPGIALGNVVGSNTANVLLVLGVPALIATIGMDDPETRRSFVLMLVASVVFIALAFVGPMKWWHGLILLAVFGLILGGQIRTSLAHRRSARAAKAALPVSDDEVEGADPNIGGGKIAFFLIAGIVSLPIGAQMLITGARTIAETFGVSDEVIGLTLVAIGTSLPELATTVAAAFRRQADVAIGNVIGSNTFNLLAIFGIALLVGPVPVEREFLRVDLWVMLAASVALTPFVFRDWKLGRLFGAVFCLLYITYVWMIV